MLGSAPQRPGAVYGTHELASALAEPFESPVVELLRRHTRTPKSSAATSKAQRPFVGHHYRSTEVVIPELVTVNRLENRGRIVIVDDVLTMGRTLYACAFHLRRAFPDCIVVGFAVLWTPFGLETAGGFRAARTGTIQLHPKDGPRAGETIRELDGEGLGIERLREFWRE